MRAVLHRSLPISLLILLSGCTDQREAIVHQSLEQQIASQSGGALALAGFRKTNGVELALAGMKMYTLEWEARINVTKDVWKSGNAAPGCTAAAHGGVEGSLGGEFGCAG